MGTGTIEIRVRVPAYGARRQARSWKTESMRLWFNLRVGVETFDLTPADRAHCSGSPLVCTFAFALPAGEYSPTLSTYDTAPYDDWIPIFAKRIVRDQIRIVAKAGGVSRYDVVLGGDVERFTVPAGVTSVTIAATGGGGSGYLGQEPLAGLVRARIPVTPGETLTAIAGGKAGSRPAEGGFNGGGASTDNGVSYAGYAGGFPGGGASDVRANGTALSNRILVAGGAGGDGGSEAGVVPGFAGSGGGDSGTPASGAIDGGAGGRGGSQTRGGGGGAGGAGGRRGLPGQLGLGGDGAGAGAAGGGGGGGYYGGGGGGSSGRAVTAGGGGGGGSSYVEAGAIALENRAGVAWGDGIVVIAW